MFLSPRISLGVGRSSATWPPLNPPLSRSSLTTPLHRSRQSIKKYVQANNKIATASSNAFDVQFNKAIKVGVEKGEFTQPKGKSICASRALISPSLLCAIMHVAALQLRAPCRRAICYDFVGVRLTRL